MTTNDNDLELHGFGRGAFNAFPADDAYLKKIRQESVLLDTKKPQS
jgi:hypothetical protein